MNPIKQRIALATIDGWTNIQESPFYTSPRGVSPDPDYVWEVIPDYLNDHNAIQALLDKQPDHIIMGPYLNQLSFDTTHMAYLGDYCTEIVPILKATAAQKCEALLRACGEWDNNNETD